MKKIIFLIGLVNMIFANTFVVADRNLTREDIKFLKDTIFYDSKYIYTQIVKGDNISFEKVRRKYLVQFLKRNNLKHFTIFKVINNLMESNDINPGDTLIIFSNMYFKINIPNKVKIDTEKQILNDGFITSSYSPFRILLDKNINKLKDVNVMIITNNNQSIFYMERMRRFYYYLFKKLKANLFFYGNNTYKCLDSCDVNRLALMYYSSLKIKKNLFTYSPLEPTNALQVINATDKSIINIGVNLRIRDDILYKE